MVANMWGPGCGEGAPKSLSESKLFDASWTGVDAGMDGWLMHLNVTCFFWLGPYGLSHRREYSTLC